MKPYIILGSISIALSIILGAFGAHAWKDILIGHESTFDTAHFYHITQSLGILIICALSSHLSLKKVKTIQSCLIIGILMFSGSLYLLSFPSTFSGAIRGILGPITPIGGLFMIAGWVLFAWEISKKK